MSIELMRLLTPNQYRRVEAILASVTAKDAALITSEALGLTRWQTIRANSLGMGWTETVSGRVWSWAISAWESRCSFAEYNDLENMYTSLIECIAASAYAYGFHMGEQGKAAIDRGADADKDFSALEAVHQQWALWLDHMAQEHPELRPQLVRLDDARQQMEKRLREDIFREAVLDGMALQREVLS
ncbi:MAG: hypothetical protein OWU33_15160 [Firmicutes bacterium]|nr:hypothetical protein [Bacillota bacterium]